MLLLQTLICLLSVHEGCEQGSPPRLWCSDGRLSRSCSSENQHTSSLGGGCVGGGGSDWPKKEAEENKENVRLDQCFSNTSGLPTDLEGWNDSVISGGLKCGSQQCVNTVTFTHFLVLLFGSVHYTLDLKKTMTTRLRFACVNVCSLRKMQICLCMLCTSVG